MEKPKQNIVLNNQKYFLISNNLNIFGGSPLKQLKDGNFLYGYSFTNDNILKNQNLDNNQRKFLKANYTETCGIYAYIEEGDGITNIYIDPFCQFPVFYMNDNDYFYISNNIFILKKYLSNIDIEYDFLFDHLAYNTPMRKLTMIKGIKIFNLNDLYDKSLMNKFNKYNVFIHYGYKSYSKIPYKNLKELYYDRLAKRAEIVSRKYDEVHLSLTGGADSRLALSLLMKYENIFCYCAGDGSSKDRVVSSLITDCFNIKESEYIYLPTHNGASSKHIFQTVFNASSYKLLYINTVLSADKIEHINKCDIRGCYGLPLSGEIKPPQRPKEMAKKTGLPSEYFTYQPYIDNFYSKYRNYQRSYIDDLFYLNNRGKSHYAIYNYLMNTAIDSYDILYDPVGLYLSANCPYNLRAVHNGATAIDIMADHMPQLAYFPYNNSPRIKFREFDDLPLIHAFKPYVFSDNKNLKKIPFYQYESKKSNYFDLLNGEQISKQWLLTDPFFKYFFEQFPFFRNMLVKRDLMSMMIYMFMIGTYLIEHIDVDYIIENNI